jgi:hypothetical protein
MHGRVFLFIFQGLAGFVQAAPDIWLISDCVAYFSGVSFQLTQQLNLIDSALRFIKQGDVEKMSYQAKPQPRGLILFNDKAYSMIRRIALVFEIKCVDGWILISILSRFFSFSRSYAMFLDWYTFFISWSSLRPCPTCSAPCAASSKVICRSKS